MDKGKDLWEEGKRERENKEKMHLGNTVTLLTTRIDFCCCCLLLACFLLSDTLGFVAIAKN